MNIIVSNPDRALLEEFEYLKIAAQDTEVTEVDCIIFFSRERTDKVSWGWE